jgi:hypothetical protein
MRAFNSRKSAGDGQFVDVSSYGTGRAICGGLAHSGGNGESASCDQGGEMMDTDGGSGGLPREVIVQLLDPTYRRPVKTWSFRGHTTISIGREAERDVEVSDPYVSRLHAELILKDRAWVLVAKGRNGVIVNARPITELVVDSDVVFRLGAAGPALRFSTAASEEEHSSTLCFDTETMPVAIVDKTRLREDVGEITSGDYFQKLQQKVEELRRQRRGP